jgi:hypothetical protein
MPPEVAQIPVLLVYIRGDRAALADQCQRIAHAVAVPQWQAEDAVLSVVAVALHHYYGAAGSIFERIARCFEGVPGRSDRWHQELLERMALDIPGLRPAVLQPETRRCLSELLSFRHFSATPMRSHSTRCACADSPPSPWRSTRFSRRISTFSRRRWAR